MVLVLSYRALTLHHLLGRGVGLPLRMRGRPCGVALVQLVRRRLVRRGDAEIVEQLVLPRRLLGGRLLLRHGLGRRAGRGLAAGAAGKGAVCQHLNGGRRAIQG